MWDEGIYLVACDKRLVAWRLRALRFRATRKLYRAHFGVRIACKALGLVLSGRMVPQGTISTCHVPGMQNRCSGSCRWPGVALSCRGDKSMSKSPNHYIVSSTVTDELYCLSGTEIA